MKPGLYKQWVLPAALLLFAAVPLAFPASEGVIRLPSYEMIAPDDPHGGGWRMLSFPKISRHTIYSAVEGENATALKAESNNAASGLIFEKRISPGRYPWISWSWKVEGVLPKGDVTRRQGDDYPARVYIAFAFDDKQAGWWRRSKHKTAEMFAGRTLPGSALTYIWANKAPQGLFVDNPFNSEVKMIVLQSGTRQAGNWVHEQRNLVADYRKAFGKDPPEIVGIAVMTDTDNTGGHAVAYYGPIAVHESRPQPR